MAIDYWQSILESSTIRRNLIHAHPHVFSMTTDPRVETDRSSPQAAPTWQILIVSDSAVEQKLLSGLFGKHQHRPFLAYGGRDALLKWSESEFDAVVLDPLLAEMHGADLVREIRQREAGKPPIPIIVLSEDPKERERCSTAGATACLGRPLRIDEFQECVLAARHSAVQRQETATIMPVDWKVALDAVGGRRDLLAELISLFETEYPTTLATIGSAIGRGDAKTLQVSAHQLKGCLRYFGRTAAGELAAELENLGRAGTVAGADGKLEPLATAIRQLIPHLRQGPG
jgi:CheY-like chemotaxis protein